MLKIGDIFGINTGLRIDPNSIPYPVSEFHKRSVTGKSLGDIMLI